MPVVSQYRGNTSPGRFADSSGNGFTLTETPGSVPNPSAPTPPEGDRWLVGPTVDGLSYLVVPVAVSGRMLTAGYVEFNFKTSLGTEPNRAVDDIQVSFNGAPTVLAPKFIMTLDSTGPLGQVRMYFFQLSPTLLFADHFFVDAGSTHTFKVEWDATGTRMYLDTVLVGSSATAPTIPTTSLWIAGSDIFGSSPVVDYGYMDNVIFSGSEVFNASELFQTTLRRRRR
jgi:hypothetical protein